VSTARQMGLAWAALLRVFVSTVVTSWASVKLLFMEQPTHQAQGGHPTCIYDTWGTHVRKGGWGTRLNPPLSRSRGGVCPPSVRVPATLPPFPSPPTQPNPIPKSLSLSLSSGEARRAEVRRRRKERERRRCCGWTSTGRKP
jgi:hypothetical protein